MTRKIEIDKNIKDLEYSYLLNLQSIFMGGVGAFIVTVSLLNELPSGWPSKIEIIFLLIAIEIILFVEFNKKLKNKMESIKEINSPKLNRELPRIP